MTIFNNVIIIHLQKTLVSQGSNKSSSITDNGYVKFDNGLILQWGLIPKDSWRYNVSFPIPFPHKCFNILFSRINYNENNTWEHTPVIRSWNNSQFSIEVRGTDRNTFSGFYIPWVALGY